MPIQPSKIFEQLEFKLTGTCSCGRGVNVIHCPMCGSTGVIVLIRLSRGNTVLLSDGSRVPDRVFRCKQCSKNFAESTCFRTCTALSLTFQRESEVVALASPGGSISETTRETLRQLAKLRPDKAGTIAARLQESGTGLLESVDETRNVNSEAAKLFQPAVVDEEDSHGKT